MITQKELKKFLSYDRKTGIFVWKIATASRVKIGDIAGSIYKNGYIHILINGKRYKAHRLAWLYVTGEYPKNQIDHKNHNRADNRIKNLRDITHQENCKNKTMTDKNTSGVVGVSWCKTISRWRATISIEDVKKSLGTYVNFSDAVDARKNAEVLYNYHENHGKGKK